MSKNKKNFKPNYKPNLKLNNMNQKPKQNTINKIDVIKEKPSNVKTVHIKYNPKNNISSNKQSKEKIELSLDKDRLQMKNKVDDIVKETQPNVKTNLVKFDSKNYKTVNTNTDKIEKPQHKGTKKEHNELDLVHSEADEDDSSVDLDDEELNSDDVSDSDIETDSSNQSSSDVDESEDSNDNEEVKTQINQLKKEKEFNTSTRVENSETVKQELTSLRKVEIGDIDESSEEGKFMKEINERKNLLYKRVIVLRKLDRKLSPEDILKFTECIGHSFPVTHNKRYKNKGLGFIYFSSEAKAKEACVKLNNAKLGKKNVKTSFYECKNIFWNFKKVNLNKLILAVNTKIDISNSIKKIIGEQCEVKRSKTGMYEVSIKSKERAFEIFKKKIMSIDGHEILVNYFYDINNEYNNILPKILDSKPGQKRQLNDSSTEFFGKKAKIEKTESNIINSPNITKETNLSNLKTKTEQLKSTVFKHELKTPNSQIKKSPFNKANEKSMTSSFQKNSSFKSNVGSNSNNAQQKKSYFQMKNNSKPQNKSFGKKNFTSKNKSFGKKK